MTRYPIYALLALALASCAGSRESQEQQATEESGEYAVSAISQDSSLEIAGDLKYGPYKLVRLSAKGLPDKAAARWRIMPGKDVQRASSQPRGVLEFVAPPGSYEIELETISGSVEAGLEFKSAYATVTIEGPTPPNPPGPGPNPPTPPGPLDPFATELRALYLADSSATKQADLMLLVELYRQAAELAKSPDVTTLSGLAQRVAGAGASLLPRERMTAMRRRIAEFIAREFGDVDAPLTPELRTKTSAAYAKVHAALKQIGG